MHVLNENNALILYFVYINKITIYIYLPKIWFSDIKYYNAKHYWVNNIEYTTEIMNK